MNALANIDLGLSITCNKKLVHYLWCLLHHIVVLLLLILLFTSITTNSNIVVHIR
jgi:hypothetical protein